MAPETHRIFIALLPNKSPLNEILSQINKLKKSCNYSKLHWVPGENIHLTLDFIGQCNAEQTDNIISKLNTIQFSPFSIQIDRSGTFRKAKALWLGCSENNTNLLRLAEKIQQDCHEFKLRQDNTPYTPHVTIARKFNDDYKDYHFPPITWRVEDFHLMQSISTESGVRYRSLHRFKPLNK